MRAAKRNMKTGRKRGKPKKVRCPPYVRRIIRPITRLNKKQIICAEIVFILTLAFAYTSFKTAQGAQGSMGYVSDEKWYVCSARNILREVFGVQPSYIDSWGFHHYTVFFSSSSDFNDVQENFRNFIRTEFEGDITYTYDKTAGVSIATQKELNYENVSRNFPQIIIIQSGYNYHPDTDSGLENFLNPEHPPLVKYIIGLSMLTLGDQPINWRIPGIIAGSLTVLLVYLIVAKLINNKFIALPVYLFAFTDPVMKAMSSIAMLDIYAAFFVTLSAWLALRRNYFLSAIAVGLAASCKLNGLFAAPALFLLMVIQHKTPLSGTRKTKLVQFAKRLINPRLYIYALIIPIFIIFIFDIPFTARFGWGWLTNNFPGNIHWFLTPKEGGSAPWGWFVNENVFTMHFNPNIFASVNSATYFASVIGLAFIPYLAYKVKRDYLVPGFWFSSTFLGFASMYLLGNKSLYSYYAIALSPMVYVLAFVFVYYLIYFTIDIRRNLGLVRIRLRNLRPKRLRLKRFITRLHRASKKRKTKKKRKLRSNK